MTISLVQLPLPSRPRSTTRSATPSRSTGRRSGEPAGARLRAAQRWSGPGVGTSAVAPVVQLAAFDGNASASALPSWPTSVPAVPDRAAVLDVLFGTAAADPFDGPEAA